MPNFLETILAQLKRADGRVVLREIRGDRFVSVTGRELLDQVQLVRIFIRSSGIQTGDRCALLAANSIRWAAFHLALMAEGVIVVPLYSRQSPAELAAMHHSAKALSRPGLTLRAVRYSTKSCVRQRRNRGLPREQILGATAISSRSSIRPELRVSRRGFA
jgi:non-ribosomal peptide synthetase component E (peptide arylation enzyme)